MSSSPHEVLLSVLDVSPVVAGGTARDALTATIDLARTADALGYHRYWVAEHHSMPAVAAAAPSVLAGQIAATTRHIRVGAGGVMLPNHAPLIVAEEFGTLEALHPDRIDLGLGRAVGGGPGVAAALNTDDAITTFATKLDELISYFETRPHGPESRELRATPATGNRPALWVLGTGENSARTAARRGLPLAFGHHLAPAATRAAAETYREHFHPTGPRSQPRVLISVTVIAADTDSRAQWLARPLMVKYLERRRKRRILLPSPEQAADYPISPDEQALLDRKFDDAVIGSADTVHERLTRLCKDIAVDELMLRTDVYHPQDRHHSYELVKQRKLGGWRATIRV